VLDRIAERSARTVDAELISEAPAPLVEQAEPDADRDRPDRDRPDRD
jgi:hypothetical protein